MTENMIGKIVKNVSVATKTFAIKYTKSLLFQSDGNAILKTIFLSRLRNGTTTPAKTHVTNVQLKNTMAIFMNFSIFSLQNVKLSS